MHTSTNWSIESPRSASSLGRLISHTGSLRASLKVSRRSSRGVPKHSVSMSSVAAAHTTPALASAAHCASASQGASTTGTPMRRSKCFASSWCDPCMCTVRLASFSASATASLAASASSSPAAAMRAWAASKSILAFSLASFRFASSPDLSVGGLPSNTYTGRTPCSMSRMVREKIPCRCEVTSPASLVRLADGAPSEELRTATRKE
mmetsp:Transcript_6302/g.26176  ORF Transcript_6302/g.26176 Transcript_6302/m.26176 type:complete len:207 (-) Transcript_6302:116-736(-)